MNTHTDPARLMLPTVPTAFLRAIREHRYVDDEDTIDHALQSGYVCHKRRLCNGKRRPVYVLTQAGDEVLRLREKIESLEHVEP
jgi:hypothetical protein